MGVYHSAFGLSVLLLLAAAGGAGCSRFNRDWRAAESAVAPTATPAGLWQGSWQSAANGHRGELRAILTPIEGDRFDARFRARFWGVMVFGYRLELGLQEATPEHWIFWGESDLGWLAGGRFECKGTASTNTLLATYESKRDHGTFTLSRPPGEP